MSAAQEKPAEKEKKLSLSVNVSNYFDLFHTGETVQYGGFKWTLVVYRESNRHSKTKCTEVFIKCEKIDAATKKSVKSWSVETGVLLMTYRQDHVNDVIFEKHDTEKFIGRVPYKEHRQDVVQCEVTIIRIADVPYFNFCTVNPEILSDVVLVIEGRNFHVCKAMLASFSTYFRTMFFENFRESNKTSVTLEDIKADSFQEVLEVIYHKSEITAGNICDLLEAAVYFDMPDIKKKCEKVVIGMSQSELSFKKKIIMADKLALQDLMKKTLESLRHVTEVKEVLPKNVNDLSPSTIKLLLQKIADCE